MADLEGVTAITGWKTQEFPMQNGAGQCIYQAGTTSLVATSITTGVNVDMLWSSYSTMTGDATAVSGVGEKAVFLKSTEGMFFVKNGTLIGLVAGLGSEGYDKRLAWATALGKIIAGRL